MIYSDIRAGQVTRDLMQARNMSIGALADSAGLSVQTVRRRLRGEGVFRLADFVGFACALDISMTDYLELIEVQA